uniref:Uncharacterized protein n=1 Tax=Tetradesmus obliquus TaxID=3088 RepID=A0A383VYR1_TETOB|eukprot:jgi/Sobl393_1/11790/SZX70351.1
MQQAADNDNPGGAQQLHQLPAKRRLLPSIPTQEQQQAMPSIPHPANAAALPSSEPPLLKLPSHTEATVPAAAAVPAVAAAELGLEQEAAVRQPGLPGSYVDSSKVAGASFWRLIMKYVVLPSYVCMLLWLAAVIVLAAALVIP